MNKENENSTIDIRDVLKTKLTQEELKILSNAVLDETIDDILDDVFTPKIKIEKSDKDKIKSKPNLNEIKPTLLIAMQENLGLGHKGNILITTQERVNKNEPPIANNIIDESHAQKIVHSYNSYDDLLDSLKSFVDDEVCRFDHHGYCQTHSVTKPCRTQTTRDIIGKITESFDEIAQAIQN